MARDPFFIIFSQKTALLPLSLEEHAPSKGHGEHHNHGGQPHIGKALVFPGNSGFDKDNHQQGKHGRRTAHVFEHFDLVFEGKLPVRLLNKGH